MKLHATNWRCDACGHVDRYNNPTIPKGWVQANIAEVDETKRGGVTHLHVCPECAAKAVDAWLPKHTWWGSTECWKEQDGQK